MYKLFFSLIIISILFSCDKEINLNPTPTTSKNLTKVTYVWKNGIPDIQEFTYDAQGRVATIKEHKQTFFFNYVSASSLFVTAKNNIDNCL